MADPLASARSIRNAIRSHRQETEEQRRLAEPVVAALKREGLCRMALPVDAGGLETDPLTALAVYEELAWAEGSVAVIALNNALPCFTSSRLSTATRQEIFSDSTRLIANSTRPSGTARVVADGYVVSGRWSLVSGCELAGWIPLMCTVMADSSPRMLPQGMPETRWLYIPHGSYQIIDTWHSSGLRGTGSHDVAVENVFVPAERTYSFMEPAQVTSPLYRMPVRATIGSWFAAACLGMAQAGLDSLVEIASTRSPVDAVPAMRDRPSVQATVATAAAELDAARVLLRESLSAVWSAAQAGRDSTLTERARSVGAIMLAARSAKSVAASVADAGGTSALYTDYPIERANRDIQALTQHIVLNPRSWEEAGRVYLGLRPGGGF